MRLQYLFPLVLAMMFYMVGCGPVTMVDGQVYQALSDNEMAEMNATSKHAIMTADRTIPASERELLAKLNPVVQVDYRGDKEGIYKATWTTEKYIYEIVIDGVFFSHKEVWVLKVTEIQPEVLDFRNAPRKSSDTPADQPTRLNVKDKMNVNSKGK